MSKKDDTHLLVLLLILFWAVRLGTFLFVRIRNMKRDKRFDGMREHFFAFLRFWVLQGVSVFVILLPAIFLFRHETTQYSLYSFAGLLVALLGLSLEATADQQKYAFSKQHKQTWIDTGIWRISRHPNYLGEMLMWAGTYMLCYATLTVHERLVGLVSPVFIIVLLLFVSGIPLLEAAADKRWGKEKEYQTYKKRVPILVPTPRSIKRLWT